MGVPPKYIKILGSSGEMPMKIRIWGYNGQPPVIKPPKISVAILQSRGSHKSGEPMDCPRPGNTIQNILVDDDDLSLVGGIHNQQGLNNTIAGWWFFATPLKKIRVRQLG